MRSHHADVSAVTTQVPDFVDITGDLEKCLQDSGVRNGHVTAFAVDATCSLIANEFESGLLSDIRYALERLAITNPHGRQLMIGSSSIVLPAVDGKLRLGTWQRVLLVELGDPQIRNVAVQVLGE